MKIISEKDYKANVLELKRPKAVLFDWDNTLVDTWPTIFEALRETFIFMGHKPWSMEEVKEKVHRSMRDAFPEIFKDKWQEAGDKYLENFRKIHLDMLSALPHAEETLIELQKLPIYVALVSNKTGINLRKEVEHIGWRKYFTKVVGATDAPRDKPHPDPVHMALEGSGISIGENVWFIGDSVTDLECAHNTGCTPIFFGVEDLSHERFKKCQPQRHFKDHKELIEFIRTI